MEWTRSQAGVREAKAASPDVATPASGPPAGRGRPQTALVVVDAAVGVRIGRLLERSGWDTLLATDPRRALVVSRRRAIDLLVTDYELPGLTGLDLAAQLWRRDAEVPVVVASGWPEAGRLVGSARLAFVPKPIDLSLLLARVNAIVAAGGTRAAPAAWVPLAQAHRSFDASMRPRTVGADSSGSSIRGRGAGGISLEAARGWGR